MQCSKESLQSEGLHIRIYSETHLRETQLRKFSA
jgi:hypothetical protein